MGCTHIPEISEPRENQYLDKRNSGVLKGGGVNRGKG